MPSALRILIFAAATLSTHAGANVSCSGPINYLGLDPSGQVAVANGAGIHTICSISTQGSYYINAQACRLFYATLLANKIAARPVTLYYNDVSLTSCSQISAWSTQPSTYFIESN